MAQRTTVKGRKGRKCKERGKRGLEREQWIECGRRERWSERKREERTREENGIGEGVSGEAEGG